MQRYIRFLMYLITLKWVLPMPLQHQLDILHDQDRCIRQMNHPRARRKDTLIYPKPLHPPETERRKDARQSILSSDDLIVQPPSMSGVRPSFSCSRSANSNYGYETRPRPAPLAECALRNGLLALRTPVPGFGASARIGSDLGGAKISPKMCKTFCS